MSVERCKVDQVAGRPDHGQCDHAADYQVAADPVTWQGVVRVVVYSCRDCLSGGCDQVGGKAWRITRAR